MSGGIWTVLELLSLTAEGVAAHAAAHDTAVENAGKLGSKLEDWWNNSYLYQLSLSFAGVP